MKDISVSTLLGKTLVSVDINWTEPNSIIFKCTDNTQYVLWHDQDCCEQVQLKDVVGVTSDLVGHPLLESESVSNQKILYDGSETWTFYKFATIKGCVTISWFGKSNGCYSETVIFTEITESIEDKSLLSCLKNREY